MNADVIASQLEDSVRKLSPAASVKAIRAPGEGEYKVWVILDTAAALKVIDFIDAHQAPTALNPDQLTLF